MRSNVWKVSPFWVYLSALALVALIAVAADGLAPYDPTALDPTNTLASPDAAHWLGTDHLGRDVFSRLLAGTRTALIASLQAVTIGMVFGVGIGVAIGYRGGWWDRIGTRVADVLQSLPAILFALAFIAVFGAGLYSAMTAVGIVFIDTCFRLTRALIISQKELPYVDAAKATGLSRRVIFRNLIPNISGPLIVQGSVLLGVALLIESMLSFLGVGAQGNQVSWGVMLEEARQNLYAQPLLAIAPGLAITVVILLFNLTGDALGDLMASRRAGHTSSRGPLPSEPARAAHAGQLAVPRPEHGTEVHDEPEPGGLLDVRALTVSASTEGGEADLISNVDLGIGRGEVYGLVGESGSGKSIAGRAIAGLLPSNVRVASGSILLEGTDLVALSARRMREVRGARIGMVFQEPMASLSPTHTVGVQLVDAVRAHQQVSHKAAVDRSRELLSLVGVPSAKGRLDAYPHQFSGGMAQRVAIAAALASDPELLIADEPTTALDVTLQAQVLDLLLDLRDRLDMSVLLITHDMGVVANTCDRVAVMYAGQVVERRETRELFHRPRHPYTEALLTSLPAEGATTGGRLPTIPGLVPPAWAWPSGCRFHPRCVYATDSCTQEQVPMADGSRCLRTDELTLRGPAHDGTTTS